MVFGCSKEQAKGSLPKIQSLVSFRQLMTQYDWSARLRLIGPPDGTLDSVCVKLQKCWEAEWQLQCEHEAISAVSCDLHRVLPTALALAWKGLLEKRPDFAECISRKDFRAATELCKQQLQKTPDSRYVLDLRKTVEAFLDAAEELEAQDQEDFEEELLGFDELADKAAVACDRAYEAMFAYLQSDEERLWALGEQAVGIFWDTGQLEPAGPRRDRLKSMAETLTRTLSSRLKLARASGIDNEWLFEGLGELWFFQELGLGSEPWLTEACREELAGFSLEGLKSASCGELCDALMQVWTVERSSVCGLLNTPPLEYGVREVLAEVRRRPLILPPKPGFYHCFYLMTHVVYTLNCFNGHLPNRRSDCPWLYAYLECCLEFWLTVAESTMSALQGEAVDAIAEAVDCLRGLNERGSQTTIRACRWLLSRQQADGFFVSPNSRRPENDYDHLHPSWTAAAALQLKRQAPGSIGGGLLAAACLMTRSTLGAQQAQSLMARRRELQLGRRSARQRPEPRSDSKALELSASCCGFAQQKSSATSRMGTDDRLGSCMLLGRICSTSDHVRGGL
eukprot:s1736_g21.t2